MESTAVKRCSSVVAAQRDAAIRCSFTLTAAGSPIRQRSNVGANSTQQRSTLRCLSEARICMLAACRDTSKCSNLSGHNNRTESCT
jgi:hypothetical protein